MGESLVPALGKIAARNDFVNAFPVPPVNISLAELQASIEADKLGFVLRLGGEEGRLSGLLFPVHL